MADNALADGSGSLFGATTTALCAMLRRRIADFAPELGHYIITTEPPDQAGAQRGELRLNLFLFDMPADAAFRRTDGGQTSDELPTGPRVRLRYLLTAYGAEARDDGNAACQALLGAAMAAMSDPAALTGTPVGPLRIDRAALTTADMAALWTALCAPYRLSAVYEIGPIALAADAPIHHG